MGVLARRHRHDILGLTGFGLFSFGRDLEPFAAAETVTSWQTSADGLLDRVVLRDDLVWSDGTMLFIARSDERMTLVAVREAFGAR